MKSATTSPTWRTTEHFSGSMCPKPKKTTYYYSSLPISQATRKKARNLDQNRNGTQLIGSDKSNRPAPSQVDDIDTRCRRQPMSSRPNSAWSNDLGVSWLPQAQQRGSVSTKYNMSPTDYAPHPHCLNCADVLLLKGTRHVFSKALDEGLVERCSGSFVASIAMVKKQAWKAHALAT